MPDRQSTEPDQTTQPDRPPARRVLPADPYRAMAVSSARLALPVGLALVVAAAVWQGGTGAVGGVLGLVVVAVVLGSSPLVMSWAVRSQASRANPHFAVMVAMGSWMLKVPALGLLLLVASRQEWLSASAFALVAGPTALVWLVAEMRAFAKARTPIYDAAP